MRPRPMNSRREQFKSASARFSLLGAVASHHRLKTGAAKRASAQPSRVREVKRDDQVRPKNKASGLRRASLYQGKGFMITCPARSGSSMLVNLLRSHPEICAHDEVFSPDKVRGLSGKYLQRSRETRVSSNGFLPKDTEILSDFCTNSSLIRTERRQLGLSLSMMSSSCRDMRLCGTRS